MIGLFIKKFLSYVNKINQDRTKKQRVASDSKYWLGTEQIKVSWAIIEARRFRFRRKQRHQSQRRRLRCEFR